MYKFIHNGQHIFTITPGMVIRYTNGHEICLQVETPSPSQKMTHASISALIANPQLKVALVNRLLAIFDVLVQSDDAGTLRVPQILDKRSSKSGGGYAPTRCRTEFEIIKSTSNMFSFYFTLPYGPESRAEIKNYLLRVKNWKSKIFD